MGTASPSSPGCARAAEGSSSGPNAPWRGAGITVQQGWGQGPLHSTSDFLDFTRTPSGSRQASCLTPQCSPSSPDWGLPKLTQQSRSKIQVSPRPSEGHSLPAWTFKRGPWSRDEPWVPALGSVSLHPTWGPPVDLQGPGGSREATMMTGALCLVERVVCVLQMSLYPRPPS